MTAKHILPVALALAAAALLAGCNNQKAAEAPAADAKAQVAAAKPVNTACPFTGGPANPSLTASAGGKTVAFCCGGCLARFNKMSEADKLATIAKAK
ncbi:MAG: hypothetical protein LW650_10870 [Planctomycetaceae bacterium]|jgi:hypothetical protein|nr:hypothetical protein [Phycisphaerales bacterium]MCE2653952.1 hypothetical protein [Planctomycetaceae bacterium]